MGALSGPCHARRVPSAGAAREGPRRPSSHSPVLGSRGRRHPRILPPLATCAGSCIVPSASCPFPLCPATGSPARTQQLGCGHLVPAWRWGGECLRMEWGCREGSGTRPAWCRRLCRAGRLPVGQERCLFPAHPRETEPTTPGLGIPRVISGRSLERVQTPRSRWRGSVPPGRGWRQAQAGAAGS